MVALINSTRTFTSSHGAEMDKKEEVKTSLTEKAAELVNTTEALDIIWLAFEEDKAERVKLSNALKSVSDHLNELAKKLYFDIAEMEG